jgi:hypothetical protein
MATNVLSPVVLRQIVIRAVPRAGFNKALVPCPVLSPQLDRTRFHRYNKKSQVDEQKKNVHIIFFSCKIIVKEKATNLAIISIEK